jgi:hypothetical protein
MSSIDRAGVRRAQVRALANLLSGCGCGPRGCLSTLLVLALGIAAWLLFQWGWRLVVDPWSVPLGGRPTLTGEWVGTIRTVSTLRLGLALRLDYAGVGESGEGRRTRSSIRGSGQLCNRRGERFDYDVRGGAAEWSGGTSALTLSSRDTSVNGSSWSFRVRWEGDRLTLNGENSFELDERPTGGRSHLLQIDPLVGQLGRAAFQELDAVCRDLAERY